MLPRSAGTGSRFSKIQNSRSPVSKDRKDVAWGTHRAGRMAPAGKVMAPGVRAMTPARSRAGNEGGGGANPVAVSRAKRVVAVPVKVASRDLQDLLPAGRKAGEGAHVAESPRGDDVVGARAVAGSCPRWILNLRTRKRWTRPLPSSRSRMKKKGNASRTDLPSRPLRLSMMPT